MEEKRVRISDIAQELGLSTATVSNVLHGKTKKISDETVRRVQALLEERQYIPSMAGILLAQNNSRIIGVVINDHEKYEGRTLEDAYVASALNHLSTEIEGGGQFMMVKKTRDPQEIIRFASMWNMDGLVIMGFCDQDYVYLRDRMRIPFVVYDGYFDSSAEEASFGQRQIHNITIDNYGGGFQVGSYFHRLGHQRALCLSDNCICLDKDRYEGFRDGFGREGAELLLIPMEKESRLTFYQEQLSRLRSRTAIFAVSDFYAAELIRFLRGQGIRVPEDISVAGFDDTPVCEMVSPALTSVRQDVALRARIALERLKDLRENRRVPPSVVLPVTLVERESSRKRF